MAQKFTSMEDAATQLGVNKDRLNQLREAGKVRAYKDGTSWKFRSEDIDKFVSQGLPRFDPGASDLSLDVDDLDLSSSVGDKAAGSEIGQGEAKPDKPKADSDLDLAAEDAAAEPASDLNLDEVDEPTVAGLDEGSDDALALDNDDTIDINKDSILLSEAELGSMQGRPPSTIIGKADLDLDADLDLSPIDKGAGPASDVRLAPESGLLPIDDDDLTLEMPSPSSGSFEGLDELEVDLEAESSRILSPEDVAKAQQAAKSSAKGKSSGLSDLGLAPLDSSPAIGASDVNLGSGVDSTSNLSGLSALELDDDDDQVLGEGSGSDVTLSGQSSGINIISPSDSGLALDEVPLDLSGSAPIGSSLDLGSAAELSGIAGSALGLGGAESRIGEDFQLTPLGEDDGDDEKDSSQVIALDDLSEETAGAPLASGFGEGGVITEDFAMGGLTPGAAPVGVVTATEMPFSIWNVMGLASCMLLLAFCGMMTFDLLRNMWSWNEVNTINSSLLEVLNPFLGR
jgi:excisionase family DNA binding protein